MPQNDSNHFYKIADFEAISYFLFDEAKVVNTVCAKNDNSDWWNSLKNQ